MKKHKAMFFMDTMMESMRTNVSKEATLLLNSLVSLFLVPLVSLRALHALACETKDGVQSPASETSDLLCVSIEARTEMEVLVCVERLEAISLKNLFSCVERTRCVRFPRGPLSLLKHIFCRVLFIHVHCLR